MNWTNIGKCLGINPGAAHETFRCTQKKLRRRVAAASKEAGYDIDNSDDFKIISRALSEVLQERAQKRMNS